MKRYKIVNPLRFVTFCVVLVLILVVFFRFFIKPLVEVKAAAPELTEVTAQAPVKSYTSEELDLLALVIYQEAGGDACSDDTRLKVGTVVMNRVADPRFPDTVRGVVLQRAQYGRLSWTGPVWPERASKAAEAHAVARAYDCAELVLRGYRALPAGTVFQAEFVQGDGIVAHQDGFYFCSWEVKA